MSGGPDLAAVLGPLIDLVRASAPAVALTVARFFPVVWLAPTFGGRLLPAPARVALVLGLSLVLMPPGAADAAPVGVHLIGALLVEALLGITLGLLSSLPFELARAGGHLVDVARGAAFAQVIAPGLGDRATPTGDVLHLALLVAVTAAGGDRLILAALAESQAALPAGALLAQGGMAHLAETALDATARLVAAALMLAAPPVVVALLADLVLGVVGRVVPQLPLFFLGMPVKTVLGLLFVALAAGPMLGVLFDEAASLPHDLADLVHRLAGAPS
jgi:flagellar biosynthesis protein FliR